MRVRRNQGATVRVIRVPECLVGHGMRQKRVGANQGAWARCEVTLSTCLPAALASDSFI